MTFNLDKCEHLVITNIRSPLCSEYKINNHSICKVSNAKYLGIIINHNLSWANHIGTISQKANAVHGFLQRNLRNVQVNGILYVCEAHFRICISRLQTPHTKCHITVLEKIQCRAAHFVIIIPDTTVRSLTCSHAKLAIFRTKKESS